MRALVTGCAGFIGSHLVDELLRMGYEVIGIDCFTDYYPKWIKQKNLENAMNHKNFKFLEANILNADVDSLLKGVDYVFHEAAQPGVRKSWGQEFEIYVDNNILATQKLLEVSKNKKIKKFVFASSSSVYGDTELPMKEDSYPKPLSPYGASKLACESLCYLYWRNYSVPVISLRYFTVYGERQRPDMAFHKFIRAMLNDDQIVIYGDGEQTRDFTYVGDVVNATILAAESEVEGEIINIGGGSRITLKEALETIQEVVGKDAKITYEESQKGDMRHTYADISKARKLLGYKPKTRLKEGLEREVEWIKELMK
ncbi:UDP-glucose 4-epimerase [Archaeoglobales archaeon]|nr:MAG: UDP-glucose 4-epimerase [Archaeoglobales archaeon]